MPRDPGPSAFDVYLSFITTRGAKGFIGIEVKYHENLIGAAASRRERYDQMGCFEESGLDALKMQPLQQIYGGTIF